MNKGFTLVGVMLSLMFAATVAILIAHLVARAEQVAGISREKFVAVNLAREGLELVRAVRDNNWYANPDDTSFWLDRGLCRDLAGDYTDSDRVIGIDSKLVRDGNDVITTNISSSNPPRLYVQSNNEWTHDASSDDTMYKRYIEINCSEKEQDPPRVTVTAIVEWTSRGIDRSVRISEQLYNWRNPNI